MRFEVVHSYTSQKNKKNIPHHTTHPTHQTKLKVRICTYNTNYFLAKNKHF